MSSRVDDFNHRRKHLANLTDKDLEEKFWDLTEKIVKPLVELAETHTSPSIERSVLLRMGFSSLESKAIVDNAIDRDLIGKGVGHLVYKVAINKGLSIREAGLLLVEGNNWDEIMILFKDGAYYGA